MVKKLLESVNRVQRHCKNKSGTVFFGLIGTYCCFVLFYRHLFACIAVTSSISVSFVFILVKIGVSP